MEIWGQVHTLPSYRRQTSMNMTTSTHSSSLMPALILIGTLTLLLVLLLSQSTGKAVALPAIDLDEQTVKAGRVTFLTVCAACHSPTGQGISGLGKPIIGSQFVNSHSDVELLAFLQTGRPINDPLNTTGVVMPARGGRLSLTDDDLTNTIAYIRSLNLPARRE
jgi:mono/diheme cytochrome c family protein